MINSLRTGFNIFTVVRYYSQLLLFKDNNQKPLLIVSVYLPTKGCHDLDEYIRQYRSTF
jgi:hypothetical protein